MIHKYLLKSDKFSNPCNFSAPQKHSINKQHDGETLYIQDPQPSLDHSVCGEGEESGKSWQQLDSIHNYLPTPSSSAPSPFTTTNKHRKHFRRSSSRRRISRIFLDCEETTSRGCRKFMMKSYIKNYVCSEERIMNFLGEIWP